MIEAVFALVLGLLIGSFLNVCIYRLPRDLSVVRPRSHCPGCERLIAWYDNIPVLSFLLLRGRCGHCGSAISWRYPFVELLTGVLFFAAVWTYGPTVLGVKLCVLFALLVGLIFADLEERILPDELTLGGSVAGLGFALLDPFEFGIAHLLLPATWPRWALSLAESAFAGLFIAGLIWGVGELYYRIRKREGLGFGDVKMLMMVGTFLGLQGAFLTLMLGSAMGSVIGLGYIFVLKKDAATYELPFGTFLGVAALAVAFLVSMSALTQRAG
jgi:leader peptidase (prepilin peptidase) / N-methyltransferase